MGADYIIYGNEMKITRPNSVPVYTDSIALYYTVFVDDSTVRFCDASTSDVAATHVGEMMQLLKTRGFCA
jgi:hypothetical protein